MVGHVWGDLLPVGAYAWRLNLMSAVFSAAAAGCLFLVAHRVLAGEAAPWRTLGAAAAAVVSAFSFTVWQNSNETEVYAIAVFTIAAICWLCLRWRDTRGSARAPHLLLVIVYLAALSIGNHLLALLVGPAVSLFMFVTLRTAPAADPVDRRVEWSEWAVLSALWVVLIGVGLGSWGFLVLGLLLLGAALVACVMTGSFFFPLAVVLVAAVGVSTYTFLYLRSALEPVLDEADPQTWDRLLAVIRREQYGNRTPFDNPLFPPGEDNPGRTVKIFGQQIANYFQYFIWQWGRSLKAWAAIPALIFTGLGFIGWSEIRRRDRGVAALLAPLWLITGLGLVVYMNFKPGFSLFWDQYPNFTQHEVRERDYFFIVSFQLWGVAAGIGIAALAARGRRFGRATIAAAVALVLIPFVLNFRAASRRHGPDVTIARDFAYNLLQSVEPYGILFAYGDNDTFPVWYLQEVEGVRQDVTLVNLSLANLDWYLYQMARRPTRPFDPAGAPAIYRSMAPATPPGPAVPIPDVEIAQLRPVQIPDASVFRAAGVELAVRAGQVFQVSDQVILVTLASSLPARPVAFGVSSGRGSNLGLDPYLILQGLAYEVAAGHPDTGRGVVRGIQGPMVDPVRTALLADSVFRYGRLFERELPELDPAARQVTTSFSLPFLELAAAAAQRGDREQALAFFRRAHHLNPSPQLADLIRRIETQGLEGLFRP